MKANAKRPPSSPFKQQPMSPSYNRHELIREDSARAQGAAAQRWRTQASPNSGGGSPMASPGGGGRGYGGGMRTPVKTPPPLRGLGVGGFGSPPGVPTLNLRSPGAGRDGGSSRPRAPTPGSVPSLASTVRDMP